MAYQNYDKRNALISAALERPQKINEPDEAYLLESAKVYERNFQILKACKVYGLAIEQFPDSLANYISVAYMAIQLENYELAASIL